MRHYEHMVDQVASGVFVASTCQVDMLRTAMFNAPIHVVGLPFDRHEVRERVNVIKPLLMRSKRVIFASRFDREKQPHFFMDFVERFRRVFSHWTVAIATGQKKLRSNDPSALERVEVMRQLGQIEIYEGLTKNQYYTLLADSRLHVNTAKQDFVSNTLNEASAFGTPSLCPAYLSFPEALNNNPRQLYKPWSVEDMLTTATRLIENPPDDLTISYSAQKQHATLDKVIDVLKKESTHERQR
jgi:glycosyltransferase involved in cell wall biosynthesis